MAGISAPCATPTATRAAAVAARAAGASGVSRDATYHSANEAESTVDPP